MSDEDAVAASPAPLQGVRSIVAGVWLVGVVLLYLFVRELGLSIVR